jgi:hypothetical protein
MRTHLISQTVGESKDPISTKFYAVVIIDGLRHIITNNGKMYASKTTIKKWIKEHRAVFKHEEYECLSS